MNPPPEEAEKLRAAMNRRRALEPPPKSKGKKRKAAAAEGEPTSKAARPTLNSNVSATSRAVAKGLAEEEAKRKANMSDAVKSLYAPNADVKETFMTRGTFNRVSLIALSPSTTYSYNLI